MQALNFEPRRTYLKAVSCTLRYYSYMYSLEPCSVSLCSISLQSILYLSSLLILSSILLFAPSSLPLPVCAHQVPQECVQRSLQLLNERVRATALSRNGLSRLADAILDSPMAVLVNGTHS